MAEAKRFAMVCAANMNRSMEAHKVALNAGLDVKSYGAGNRVKLPGASRDNPNVFEFENPGNGYLRAVLYPKLKKLGVPIPVKDKPAAEEAE